MATPIIAAPTIANIITPTILHNLTHGDFDGVVSGMELMCQFGFSSKDIDFIDPATVMAGKATVQPNTVVSDLPYVIGSAMWIDHHASNIRLFSHITVPGIREAKKSCARVIADYFKITGRDELLDATDRVDSASLTREDVLNPSGYVLLSNTVDTNIVKPEDIAYNRRLIELLATKNITQILDDPEVLARVSAYREYVNAAMPYYKQHLKTVKDLAVIDLRDLGRDIELGKVRYLPYVLKPDCVAAVTIYAPPNKPGFVSIGAGENIFDRRCKVDIGAMMCSLGGGGHRTVGGVMVPVEKFEETYKTIIDVMCGCR